MTGFEHAQWVSRDWRSFRTIADFTTLPPGTIQRSVRNESVPEHNAMSYERMTRRWERRNDESAHCTRGRWSFESI